MSDSRPSIVLELRRGEEELIISMPAPVPFPNPLATGRAARPGCQAAGQQMGCINFGAS